ncbi:MAG: FkbM family methyltransferase [Steroidobacteraceae bacterium]
MNASTIAPPRLPSDLSFLAPVETDGLMRVGNPHRDGGYVVPGAAVRQSDALISFGVGTHWSFENHFRQLNPAAEIHAYDHTVGELRFRRDYQRGLVKYLFVRTSLADVRNRWRIWRSYRAFFPSQAMHFQEEIHHGGTKPNYASIDKIFARTSSQRVFLKIDTEGCEYSIVDDVLRYAPRITCITIEFHDTEALRDTFCSAVKRWQRAFHIVHLHGTNLNHVTSDGLPNCVEMTFTPGAAPQDAKLRSSLPLVGLDSPNNPNQPDRQIRFS